MVQQGGDQLPILPSRSVFYPRACTTGGGRFASAGDSSKVVIAGGGVLRILKILDNGVGEGSNPLRTCVGPGGATIEANSNMWNASGLKVDSAPTDVIWARGQHDNMIVTSARNGEIIYWDINRQGNKYETRVKEHNRAVNKLALSPCLPYLFASGSQDGYLRLWDIRNRPGSTMKVYHATPIRTLAMCPVPSHPYYVCVGLESGNIQRWDLRSKAQPLERVTLAHSSAILSMDWQQPSMRENGLGWLVTSGMDRRVKVWDLTVPHAPSGTSDREALIKSKKMGSNGPMRTLCPSFVGRCVKWRPGCDTEVSIVSSSDDGPAVEIWDIRRGWIGKWAMNSREGVITDIAFPSADTLHALHASGTFTQYDLRPDQYDNPSKPWTPQLYKPLDAIPRVAMAWTPKGDIAFVADRQDDDEIPFDDYPTPSTPAKATSDPVYVPREQTIGTLPLLSAMGFDTRTMERLARGYVLGTERNMTRTEVCEHNAQKAAEEGQFRAARVWAVMAGLLDVKPMTDIAEDEDFHAIPSTQSKDEAIAVEAISNTELDSRHMQLQSSLQSGLQSSPRASPHSPHMQLPSRPSSSSPRPITSPSPRVNTIALPPDPQKSPVSLYEASISSAGVSGTGSAAYSTRGPPFVSPRLVAAVGTRSVPSRPEMRRMSVSVPYIDGGALDDSDSESLDEEEDDDEDDIDGSDSVGKAIPVGDGRGRIKFEETRRISSSFKEPSLTNSRSSSFTAETRSSLSMSNIQTSSGFSPAPRLTSYAHRIPSPSSRSRPLFSQATRKVQANPSPLSKTIVQLRERSPDSHLASDERSTEEHDADDDEDANSQSDSGSESGSGSESDLESDGDSPPPSRSLIRSHESLSSIKTVTDRPPSLRSTAEVIAAVAEAEKAENVSTRKPSPQPRAASGLGLSNMGGVPGEEPTIITIQKQVAEEELIWTKLVWDGLKESVTEFSEIGNVQMCALLAIVAPKELDISPVQGARFVDAYVEMLSQLQLHTLAAHVRKYAPYDLVKATTQVQTTVYPACGKCNSSIKIRAPGIVPICEKCKSQPTLCSICHLPVRKLLIHCTTCGHGGHQACYRTFYLARPLTEMPTRAVLAYGTGASSTTDSYATDTTTYYSLSDSETTQRDDGSVDDDTGSDSVMKEERAGSHVRVKVLGHVCAAGCGHWCWAANERFIGS